MIMLQMNNVIKKNTIKKYALTTIVLLGSISNNMAFSTENNVSPMQQLASNTPPATPSVAAPELAIAKPAAPEPTEKIILPVQTAPSVINCNYTIPEPISEMTTATIIQWANYAAVHTFTYDFQNYDKQFKELKQCYTTVGWESFVQAMKTSNNLKSAQEEHLFVSAKINGDSQLTAQSKPTEQPAWVVRIPINVTYQNQDKEVSQDMYIDLTIKTVYGSPLRLGINQIVASPKSAHELM